MALLSDINTQLVSLVSGALTTAGVASFQVGSEWPPKQSLQDAGNGGASIVAIIHKMTAYQSKNLRFQHSVTQIAASITTTVSDIYIGPSRSVTITLAFATGFSSISLNDAVSCQLSNGDYNVAATTAALAGATLTSLAAALAASINTAFAGTGITATSLAGVVTISSTAIVGYNIVSHAASVSQVAETYKWASRSMQLNVWCGDLNTKATIRNAIETLMATLDDAEGFALSSGEWVSLKLHGARPDDADTDKDVFTDLWLFAIDHQVDVTLNFYPVVATIPQIS